MNALTEVSVTAASAAAFQGMGDYLRTLAVPVAILLGVMAIDYMTGVAAAWKLRELSSRTGWRGIMRKIQYMTVVTVGVVVDLIIQVAADRLGVAIREYYFFALLVVIWLILNECISILENISIFNVPFPKFLMKIIKGIRKIDENKGQAFLPEGEKDDNK